MPWSCHQESSAPSLSPAALKKWFILFSNRANETTNTSYHLKYNTVFPWSYILILWYFFSFYSAVIALPISSWAHRLLVLILSFEKSPHSLLHSANARSQMLLPVWPVCASLLQPWQRASRPLVESRYGISLCEQARQEVLAGEGSLTVPSGLRSAPFT